MSLKREFLLRPEVVFLNHGSYGACPRPVFEAYQQWQRELEAQPVEFLGRRARGLLHDARAALGAYVGAAADDLVYVPNATFGVNVVARSLSLAPGDEVLGTDHEYGAMGRTWQFVCERQGARYIPQPIPVPFTSAEAVIEALWAGVTRRTRVLFLSHIASPTALTFPLAGIVARAREAGIITVVDGAHAPGQVPLDLQALGVDFYAANCHKWLCAPKGSAFLYARRAMQPSLSPLVVSWGWHSRAPGASRFLDEHELQGTRDIAAFLSVPAAIAFFQKHDWPRVQQDCHTLVAQARRTLEARTGLPQLSLDSTEWYAQMASLPLPPCDTAALKQRLYDDYMIEIPIMTWQGRPYIRVSVQGYNTASDIETLLRALEEVLPAVSPDAATAARS